MKLFCLTLLIAIFSVTFTVADDSYSYVSGNYKFNKTYQTSAEAVTFYHERHVDRSKSDCGFCHSALRIFGGVSELYAHDFCKACHESRNGPTECSQCHDNHKTAKIAKK